MRAMLSSFSGWTPAQAHMRQQTALCPVTSAVCSALDALPGRNAVHSRQCTHRRQTLRWGSCVGSSRLTRCASTSTVCEKASDHAVPTSWPDPQATADTEGEATEAAAALQAELTELQDCMSGLTGLVSEAASQTVSTVRFARVHASLPLEFQRPLVIITLSVPIFLSQVLRFVAAAWLGHATCTDFPLG